MEKEFSFLKDRGAIITPSVIIRWVFTVVLIFVAYSLPNKDALLYACISCFISNEIMWYSLVRERRQRGQYEQNDMPEGKCTITLNCRTLSPSLCKGFKPLDCHSHACLYRKNGKCTNSIECVQALVRELAIFGVYINK